MRKLDSKRDLPECGRIATAILDMMSAASVSGAGHPPVTLDVNAATVLTIGADPTSSPQELGLETQAANTFWAGPTTGADAVPTFRAIVAGDISDILPIPTTQGQLLISDATPEWSLLARPGVAGYALVSTAVTEEWDPTPVWADLHTFTGAPAIEIDVASGDPRIVFDTQGTDKFALGVDDSDSDKFKINSGAALADPSDFEMDSNGNVEIGGDFNLLTGKGIIHADSANGNLLVLSGGRYVPGSATVADISDLAYAAPGLTLGVANVEGAANTVIRTDATILAFDAVVPTTIQCDDAAATGAAAVTARRDHKHAIVCAAPGANLSVSTTNAEGTATSFARSDHSHAITSSANPGAATSILKSDAGGLLQLVGLGVGATPSTAGHIKLATAISAATNDGSDNAELYFSGGGGVSVTRGSYVAVYGNEHASKQGRLELVAGDDAADGEIKLFTGNAAVAVTVDRSQQVGIGDVAPGARLGVLETDAVTAAVTDVATFGHDTSGAAADLFGGGIGLELESSTSVAQRAARIVWMWSDATHASRNSLIRFNTYNAGNVVGYFGIWSGDNVAGAAITVIPGGSGDVTKYIWLRVITVASDGNVESVVLKLEPGDAAADIFNDAGGNVCQITCAAGGNVTVARSAGALTYDVQVIMSWI